MPRTPAPVWLSRPSRFARLDRGRALAVLAGLALLLAASLLAIGTAGPPPVPDRASPAASEHADVVLYETIVADMRHGADYYVAAASALRTQEYPLRPFVTFRLPALAVLQSTLPPLVTLALLYALALAVLVAWHARLREALKGWAPVTIGVALLIGGMAAFVQPELIAFHEVWAGLLIALALALWRRDRWIECAAIALAAMLLRETAALFALVMAALALVEGSRREALGWAVVLGVFALVVALHAAAVARVTGPLDPASPGWAGMLGFGFFVKTMHITTALDPFPAWIASPLIALALFGWASWDHPLALRVLATLSAYAALLSLFARVDTFYWGMLVAPVVLIGLVFARDGLRDLWVRALDRRRVRVQRITR